MAGCTATFLVHVHGTLTVRPTSIYNHSLFCLIGTRVAGARDTSLCCNLLDSVRPVVGKKDKFIPSQTRNLTNFSTSSKNQQSQPSMILSRPLRHSCRERSCFKIVQEAEKHRSYHYNACKSSSSSSSSKKQQQGNSSELQQKCSLHFRYLSSDKENPRSKLYFEVATTSHNQHLLERLNPIWI